MIYEHIGKRHLDLWTYRQTSTSSHVQLRSFLAQSRSKMLFIHKRHNKNRIKTRENVNKITTKSRHNKLITELHWNWSLATYKKTVAKTQIKGVQYICQDLYNLKSCKISESSTAGCEKLPENLLAANKGYTKQIIMGLTPEN